MRIVVSAFGGLTNLIAIAYAILRILDNAPRARLTLAVATLACMPLTLLSLNLVAEKPVVGCAVWMAGLLLMAVGDIWNSLRRIRRGQSA